MRRVKRVLWGVTLLAIGMILALSAFEVISGEMLFAGWWTLFLIVPSAVSLLTDYDKSWAIAGLLVGVVLMLVCQNVLTGYLLQKLLLPVLIIFVGIRMISKNTRENRGNEALRRAYLAGSGLEEACSIFRETKVTCNKEQFTGVDLTAAFGKLTLDLTDNAIEDQSVIRANGIFGSVGIILPEKTNVVAGRTRLFGRLRNNKAPVKEEGVPTVYVYGNASFGDISIK